MLVNALEAQSEGVPRWERVTECLLHEETKLQEKTSDQESRPKALATNSTQSFQRQPKGPRSKSFRCHVCNIPGHFK